MKSSHKDAFGLWKSHQNTARPAVPRGPAWRVDARHLCQEALRPLTEAAHWVLARAWKIRGSACHKPTLMYRCPKIVGTANHHGGKTLKWADLDDWVPL